MNSTISNTLRALFGTVAAVILLGMMLSDGASLLLWLPVLGLGFAAATGKCFMLPVIDKVLHKLNIER